MERLPNESVTSAATPHSPSFHEWLASMPLGFQLSAHRIIDEGAFQNDQQRGGGVSTKEQEKADKLKAEQEFFNRYGPPTLLSRNGNGKLI